MRVKPQICSELSLMSFETHSMNFDNSVYQATLYEEEGGELSLFIPHWESLQGLITGIQLEQCISLFFD